MPIVDSLKRHFVAGLVLIAPLVVTLFVIRVLAGWVLGIVTPPIQATRLDALVGDRLAAQLLVVAGLLVVITLLGWITERAVGRRVLGSVSRLVNFVPLVSVIYGSVRQVAEGVVNRNTQYESVVLVEYPREGIYSIGLVTGNSPAAAETLAGQEVYNVFFPASPNPTQGKLVLVPEDRVHQTDLPVRRGLQLLMTTGMVDEEEPEELLDEVAPPAGATAER